MIMSKLKHHLAIILFSIFFMSTANAMVPYGQEGLVGQVLSDINQIIIDNQLYTLAPNVKLHHQDTTNKPVIDFIKVGKTIGFSVQEVTPLTPNAYITDIWIIE